MAYGKNRMLSEPWFQGQYSYVNAEKDALAIYML